MTYKGYYITFGHTKCWNAHTSHIYSLEALYSSDMAMPLATFAGNNSKSLAEYRAKEFINNLIAKK